jgi:fumarate hydratase class II
MAEHDDVTNEAAAAAGEYRIEHDTMGEVRVPRHAKYQAQTQRAVENFPISGRTLERTQVRALALIKAAAATVNVELGVVPAEIGAAIQQAAHEIATGQHYEDFPLDVFQTGSGTSSNMNTNEVISTLATESLGRKVHPNDHVNASQSSNDVFPTSIHLAATETIVYKLLPALAHLEKSLQAKADAWADVVKSGRTHLMDATPVTLGQEFGGYAAQIRLGQERLRASLPRVAELPLGGTAVGTGINTPPGFAAKVIAELARSTGLELTEARNHFEAQSSRDGLVEVSGQLRTIAISLTKICNDLRWMGSGNDATVAFAGSQGNFELNVMFPVIGRNLLESINLLANASRVLADRCIDGIVANVERCRAYAESSPSIVTPLNKYIGYEEAATVAKQALKEGKTIKTVVIERGHLDKGTLTAEQLDATLDVLSMTHP